MFVKWAPCLGVNVVTSRRTLSHEHQSAGQVTCHAWLGELRFLLITRPYKLQSINFSKWWEFKCNWLRKENLKSNKFSLQRIVTRSIKITLIYRHSFDVAAGQTSARWYISTWWRHQVETFSALLAICAGNSPVHGEFPTQRPVTRSFDFFFDIRPNKRLSKQSWGWWFETLLRSLWRQCNGVPIFLTRSNRPFAKLSSDVQIHRWSRYWRYFQRK